MKSLENYRTISVNVPMHIYNICVEYKQKCGLNLQAMATLALIQFFKLEEKGYAPADVKNNKQALPTS